MSQTEAESIEQASPEARLRDLIDRRRARVAVIGLGYVGLPMAIEFVKAGFPVTGIEVDNRRCGALLRGESYVSDLSDEDVRAAVGSGGLSVTDSSESLGQADVVLTCVPTPLRKSKDPDLTAILAATDALSRAIRPGQLIVLESTTYPGTTEEILQPVLERSGLRCGRDFFLAFSPERVDPGNTRFGVRKITKLVGGVTPRCTALATEFYGAVVDTVVPVSNPRVAEAAKLLENTFRSVNIGLVNELAMVCRHLGVDVWEVIDAAATKPFGFMPHYPGPGIGGHCIPLDPHYLSWKARLSGYEPRFIALASEINASMPRYVVDMVTDALNDRGRCVRGSRIHLLGAAYKPNVGDARESPAMEILEHLHQRGADLSYSDPYVPVLQLNGAALPEQPLDPEALSLADCVIVVTHHAAFDYQMVVDHSSLVIDTRNATRGLAGSAEVRYL